MGNTYLILGIVGIIISCLIGARLIRWIYNSMRFTKIKTVGTAVVYAKNKEKTLSDPPTIYHILWIRMGEQKGKLYVGRRIWHKLEDNQEISVEKWEYFKRSTKKAHKVEFKLCKS
ncbi:hypothetical protein WN83_15180 [Listeria monocytogenes]|nr:hypothetical protein [Listeria monocytogenes]EAD4869139.1 hypothetical protein [Listeria monocytogenes]